MSNSQPTSRCDSLIAEYQRRALQLKEAAERSSQMERDFLETKVLNTEANEAMREWGRIERNFQAWLLENHAELFTVASETSPSNWVELAGEGQIEPEDARIYRFTKGVYFVLPGPKYFRLQLPPLPEPAK
jgi:hypothetical protein